MQINVDQLSITGSTLDSFLSCQRQWAKIHLEGLNGIPSARAAIGTSIHKAAHVLWSDAIETKEKDTNITKLLDAAIQEYQELDKTSLQYDTGEDKNTAEHEVVKGVEIFIGDIVPYFDIPQYTEKYLSIDIQNHPLVNKVTGTADYIIQGLISDLKSTKRKCVPTRYSSQLSIYSLLAEKNNLGSCNASIQNVILKQKPEGQIFTVPVDIKKAEFLVSRMLKTIRIAAEGVVPLEILFRGNPTHYLCSVKYCNFFNGCPYVK